MRKGARRFETITGPKGEVIARVTSDQEDTSGTPRTVVYTPDRRTLVGYLTGGPEWVYTLADGTELGRQRSAFGERWGIRERSRNSVWIKQMVTAIQSTDTPLQMARKIREAFLTFTGNPGISPASVRHLGMARFSLTVPNSVARHYFAGPDGQPDGAFACECMGRSLACGPVVEGISYGRKHAVVTLDLGSRDYRPVGLGAVPVVV